MSSWTIRRKFRSLIAARARRRRRGTGAAALPTDPQLMQDRAGTRSRRARGNGWHYADRGDIFFGRARCRARVRARAPRRSRKPPRSRAQALDLATEAATTIRSSTATPPLWYVRAAAGVADRRSGTRRTGARAHREARCGRSATPRGWRPMPTPTRPRTLPRIPDDAGALVDQVDADLRAYAITKRSTLPFAGAAACGAAALSDRARPR